MRTALAAARRVVGRLLQILVIALMGGLATIVVLGVAFRKAGAALVWYDEVASVMLAWLTYYGACLAALERAHIGFPTLLRAVPPRPRLLLFAVRETLVLAFFALAAWMGWRVLLVLEGTSLVSLPWVSTQFTQSVIPVGAALFMLAEVLSIPAALEREAHAGEGEEQ